MTASIPQIHAQTPLLVGVIVGVVAIALLFRLTLPRLTKVLLLLAIVLLAPAAGDIHAMLPRRGDVVVMVDLSPSTRSAAYRNRATLDARLKQLLGSRSYRLIAFAEDESPMPPDAKLADMPATQTNFSPPATDAIVLLSDGRFELPASASPTYAVIDPGLIDPLDAGIDDVRVEGVIADVTLTGRGPQRVLSLSAATPLAVSSRDTTVYRVPLTALPPTARAELSRGDIWPENDVLTFSPPQPAQRQRWWISATPAPAGWTAVSPDALTTQPEDLLAPSVIALHNLPADALPPATQDRLQQYVRDLGGSLLILGGDHAFAAGGYGGTTLDALSPLASDPPTPTTHWMLLTDASGSMAAGDKWTSATGALAAVIRELPPADVVSVGSFSSNLTWWINGTATTDARQKPLPPAGATPGGPTNLQPVLEKLVESTSPDLRKELLILTDGETTLTTPDALATAMKTKQIRMHVLAIGNGAALPALKSIADATGGSYAAELDAKSWLVGARKLLQASRADRILKQSVAVRFQPPLQQRSLTVAGANQTWLKAGATALAISDRDAPMAAMRQVGNGRVAAAAFDLPDQPREELAALIARPPRDPRFRVNWQATRDRIIVDAADGERMLNGLSLDLNVRPTRGEPTTLPFNQTAPGRYELQLPRSPHPRLAVLRLDGREVDRRTIAGTYAREFAGIGTDEAALRELAKRTGGRVIGPAEVGPILPTLWRDTALTPWLCGLAVVLIGGGLIHWKRS